MDDVSGTLDKDIAVLQEYETPPTFARFVRFDILGHGSAGGGLGFFQAVGGGCRGPLFVVDGTPRSYSDSVHFCESKPGYTVASIHSQAENDQVITAIASEVQNGAWSGPAAYLGASEIQNGQWVWEDGSPSNWMNPLNDGMNSPTESRLAVR